MRAPSNMDDLYALFAKEPDIDRDYEAGNTKIWARSFVDKNPMDGDHYMSLTAAVSYGTAIGLRLDEHHVAFNHFKYSVSTTRHQSTLAFALHKAGYVNTGVVFETDSRHGVDWGSSRDGGPKWTIYSNLPDAVENPWVAPVVERKRRAPSTQRPLQFAETSS